MSAKTISSPHNPRVKAAVKLRDRRQRDKQGRIVIDGAREIRLAMAGGVQVLELFVCSDLWSSNDDEQILGAINQDGLDVWHVTRSVFEKLAFGSRAEGIVAVARTPKCALDEIQLPADSLVAVLEGVEKPGNVGAVLRSADGAGVSALIVANPGTDLFNPNCIRASLGTVFTLPVAAVTSEETLVWLRERKVGAVYAACVDAERAYTEVDLCGPTAVVLGSEAHGLSSVWRGDDVTPIRLPMQGTADSLNVSATAAVVFYESLRQRTLSSER